MVIHTKSPKAKESQQVVLEFLLANHPLDCPVCDQSGECKLQDYYMEYGLYDPRFNDVKVKKTKKAFSIGPTIMLDQERCILCSRCVRFTDEITKTHEFGIFNRGDRTEVDVYKPLDNKYSGCVADICPVGALTDKDFRFKMRVWYLGSGESVCPGCSRGCNITIDYEKSRPYHSDKARVMRLKPRYNRDVNRWWMCDEGRYGYKPIDANRLLIPKAPGTDGLRPVNGNGAYRTQSGQDELWKEVIAKLALALKSGRWGLIASQQYTNEEIGIMDRLFRKGLGWKDFGFHAPGQEGYEDDFLLKADKNPNTAGAVKAFGLSAKQGDLTPVVEKAKRGELDGLFVFSHDLSRLMGLEAFNGLRAKLETLVFEGPNDNVTAATADFTLASASYAEKEGLFTNFEGRVQPIRKVLEPLGHARPTARILSDLAAALEVNL